MIVALMQKVTREMNAKEEAINFSVFRVLNDDHGVNSSITQNKYTDKQLVLVAKKEGEIYEREVISRYKNHSKLNFLITKKSYTVKPRLVYHETLVNEMTMSQYIFIS